MILFIVSFAVGIHGLKWGIALGKSEVPPGLATGLCLGGFVTVIAFIAAECVLKLFSAVDPMLLQLVALIAALVEVIFVLTSAKPSMDLLQTRLKNSFLAFVLLPVDSVFVGCALALIGYPTLSMAFSIGSLQAALFLLGLMLGKLGIRISDFAFKCVQTTLLLAAIIIAVINNKSETAYNYFMSM